MLRLVLFAALTLAGTTPTAAAAPVPVTFAGAAGLRFGASLASVKQRLGVNFAGEQSGNELSGAICNARVRGVASFRIRSGVPRLSGIAFTAGVRTPEGIAPGATLRKLKRAYGRRLILDHDQDVHTGDADIVHATRRGGHDLIFMVEDGLVVSIGLDTPGVLGVHCPTVSTAPPPSFGLLSLTGASGAQPVMPEQQLFAVWPWFPQLTDAAGSGWESWMPICAGTTRGAASFGGGALRDVWFSSGASTDKGISIGSSFDELQTAYGADLQNTVGSGLYFVYASGPPPVATLGFRVDAGVVTALGFGGRQGIGGGIPPRIWC